MLDSLVAVNGVYDIMCAIGILFLPNMCIFSTLARLHSGIFTATVDPTHPLLQRVLAYWILTYGITRMAIIMHVNAIDYLVATTYFLEAAAFVWEDAVHATTQRRKVLWVSCSSTILGSCVLLNINPETSGIVDI
jgi:hypothetical protein